jgi:bifunctional non-homologous end joining protein LigD
MGVLEIHPWGSRAEDLERPDRLVFDLDPGPGVTWTGVVDGARTIRGRLRELGLESFVKTSGGKGLHVVVPVKPKLGWDEVKGFTQAVAARLAREEPKRWVATMTKAKREGRIFVDYLRNGRGATSIAAYSTRARPGAPVSTPVAWEELDELPGAAAFTVANLRARLTSAPDPWAGFGEVRQSITADARRRA